MNDDETLSPAHGGGGRLQQRLLAEVVLPALGLEERTAPDAATLPSPGETLALSGDGYVVRPRVFPGGDIGSLAVHGTVNDLAMAGARPLWLTLGMVLEEGLSVGALRRCLVSVAAAATASGVRVVAGDTKVVERGRGDGIYLHTSGVGVVEGHAPRPEAIEPGDALLVSGDIGRHGLAILAAREGLALEPPPASDSAPVVAPVTALMAALGADVHALRDPTRGGVTAACHELAAASGCRLVLDDGAIPVAETTRGVCEILGLDPLNSACEGRFIAAVAGHRAAEALAAVRACPGGEGAALIGGAEAGDGVGRRLATGVERNLILPAGEQLPRIC